jgi:VIT1/CCC1 family predicted Fe2+/Mn2+ transporter
LNRSALALLGPAIFGGFDGANSILGVVQAVPAGQVVHAAALGAVSAGMSMAAGSYLSERSRSGLLRALVLGAATALGTLLPALPYLLWRGAAALAGIGVVLVLFGAGIAAARTRLPGEAGQPPEPWGKAAFETYAVLVAVCAVVALAGG